ncbi:MAG: glycerate kinase [Chloroflexi bacterium]|nr:glycerate kinase [Chloroflexota bacterium]MCY4246072.1 glycerate kinase [Chloroflexota bacterium]
MKILIAAGAFKQSLTAAQACTVIARGLRESGLDAELLRLPIADGGNGTLDAFLATGGERVTTPALDPLLRPIQADYGLIDGGRTAVIEMALASGLELLARDELDALSASSFGAGQLMMAALERGARRFIIGLGGSATTDGGMGCLQALGARLLDANGQELPPGIGGGELGEIAQIDASGLDERWRAAQIIIASDVDNPTLGEYGAAHIFSPQKGADAGQVALLERALRHCFTLIHEQRGVDLRQAPGGGAAGAFAAGLLAFFNCELTSGIELMLRHNGFRDKLSGCALVVTGEGKLDAQTLSGKAPLGVARLAADYGVPTIAMCGGLAIDEAELRAAGVAAALPIVDAPMNLEAALDDAAGLLQRAARRLGYLLALRSEEAG